jgi:hypothetical protein
VEGPVRVWWLEDWPKYEKYALSGKCFVTTCDQNLIKEGGPTQMIKCKIKSVYRRPRKKNRTSGAIIVDTTRGSISFPITLEGMTKMCERIPSMNKPTLVGLDLEDLVGRFVLGVPKVYEYRGSSHETLE